MPPRPLLHLVSSSLRYALGGAPCAAARAAARQRGACPFVEDAAVGHVISQRMVDAVFVDAIKVAGNGDVAGNTGTYPLALLCKQNDIPFYVICGLANVDVSSPNDMAFVAPQHPSQHNGWTARKSRTIGFENHAPHIMCVNSPGHHPRGVLDSGYLSLLSS